MDKKQIADKLFSKLIHLDRVRCQRCGSSLNLECAHIITRGHKNLRWNEDNAILLCRVCHAWWHTKPDESMKWFALHFPINHGFLMREKNKLEFNLGTTLPFRIKEMREKLKELSSNLPVDNR